MKERDYIIATNQARLMIAVEALSATSSIPGAENSESLRQKALSAIADLLKLNTDELDSI